jgi:outer membrane protein
MMNMKRIQISINILLIIGLISICGYQFLKREKIVSIDIGKLLQEYQGMKDARVEYDKKLNQWNASIDTLVEKWQQQLKQYEKDRPNMSTKERELKEELLYTKQQQLNQYREAIKNKAQEEEERLTRNVVNHINDYVDEYGKRKGYSYILGANSSGSIVYADKSRDITDEILDGLQKEFKLEKGK